MWVLLMLALPFAPSEGGKTVTRFTNIQCEVLDPTFFTYKTCELKVLGREIVAFNFHVILLKGFFDNAMVNLSLWRKYNGFRPFMFNKTTDFCAFMSKKTNKLSFEQIVVDALAENSNINHSCPYHHDLIIHNMVFKEEFIKYLPVPAGEYKLQFLIATNKKRTAKLSLQILRKEDLLTS